MYQSQGAASGATGGNGPTVGTVAASTRFPKTMTFEVNPDEIFFHDFEPHKTYEASLHLKNVTKEAQYIRVARPASRFLVLKLPRHGVTTMKVASGLSITYKVLFTPEENRDYACDLVVTTDHEEFTVPVRAVAGRGRLTLPGSFTVSPCPVKGSAETALFLRNTGRMECQWRAEAPAPFAITPSSGIVPPDGGVLPVSVVFSPPTLQQYDSTIVFRLGPEEDMVQELPLTGSAVEVAVVLEQSTLEFPSTFVTLENQAVVRVRNDSDYTVHFTWKSDRTEAEEAQATEHNLLQQSELVTYTVMSKSQNDATQKRLARERLDILAKAGRVFDDDVFTLEPVSGVIYAKGSKEFVVTFNPQLTMDYLATAYLDISGRRQRLPLQVKGTGLGPQCELEYSRLDIGDIFVGALHEYEVAIMNKGCIEARYTVLPQDTLMGQKFTFSPSEGVLAPGTHETLVIRLQSDLVGLISETFRIHLHGSLADRTLRFRGRVTGPSLQFDVENLDFGNVSYNFLHSRTTTMLNTGQVPIHFHLRIPESTPLHTAITVVPSDGVIAPNGRQEIRVDFTSSTVGDCETVLLVDVDGVGKAVESLPIRAACLVPALQLSMEQLHYGTCFVGHEYTMNLEVVNKTALLGRYEVTMLNEDGGCAVNASVVIGSAGESQGAEEISPRSRSQVPVKLTPLVVGGLRMTLYVRVLGSDEPPLPVLVTATARGPTVTVDSKAIAFGTLTLLEHAERDLLLSNTSPIPAFFTVRLPHRETREGNSVFHLEQTEGEIPPYGSFVVKVSACLDDSRPFTDKIQVKVRYAEDDAQVIAVSATGKGYALVPIEPIDKIDFGDAFTETQVEKPLVLTNKGRRDIDVLWTNLRGTRVKPGGPPIVFHIHPENAVISAGESFTFKVQGLVKFAGNFTEEFVLKDKRVFRPILTSSITGNFVPPLIAYSTKKIGFDYIYGAEGEAGQTVMTKTFTMKNITTRPLRAVLKRLEVPSGSPSPFHLVEPTSFGLASGETRIIGVTCNTAYRHDNIAHSVKGRVLVAFENHPFTEYVSLSADIAFPTIRIEPEGEQVNFGSILVDTEGRSELTLTNLSSSVAANFLWSIECHDEAAEGQSEVKQKQFDFVPFRGTIPPGGQRVVEAVFYGTRGRHEATATCMLEGGPKYKVGLVGWSDAAVRFDCTSLDFGVMHHRAVAKKTITISSLSRVAVPFTVDLASLRQPGSLTVKPLSGIVTNKVSLTVAFRPLIPEEVVETFFVQVGHLDPQPITVCGLGQTSAMTVALCDKNVTLTRVEDATYLRCLEELADSDWVPYHTKAGYTPDLSHVVPLAIEAERMAFCRNILATSSTSTPSATEVQRVAGGGTEKKKEEPLVLSRYVVEFGHMTRQETRTVNLTLVNTSMYSVSVLLDKRAIEPLPLRIEPLKIPTMSPFTETEVSLILAADDPEKIATGENQFEFFLDINKGPRVIIEVRCFVATPILVPFENTVDFGDILLGHVKKIPLHFVNNEAVPCSWKMLLIESKRKEEGDANAGAVTPTAVTVATSASAGTSLGNSRRQFKVNKDRGTLAPNNCMTIQLNFMSRFKGPAKAKLRLRYTSNPEDYYIVIRGNVVGVDVEFSPSPLVFPPVFPCQTMRNAFVITNNEERPLEVFSMQLDQKYRVELNILRHTLAMQNTPSGKERELHLPIREAGYSLPGPLLDAAFTEIQTEESGLEYKEPEADDDNLTERRAGSRGSSRRPHSSQPRTEAPGATPSQRERPATRAASAASGVNVVRPQLVVVTGPPFAGRTTQTRKLMEERNLTQLDLDLMVRAEAEFDTAEGESIRNILSERRERGSARTTEEAVNCSTPVPVENLVNSNVVKILYALVTRHLTSLSGSENVIVDDIKSILTDDREAVLFAIEKAATTTGRALQVISLCVSEATVGLRRNLEKQQRCSQGAEEAMTVPLTEDEYEQLSADERDAYNHRLLHYNTCKRALAEATKEVARFSEERKSAEQLSVQAMIDASIAAKEEQEALLRSTTKGKKHAPEPRPKPVWNNLSELDQYKELYMLLRRMNGTMHTAVDAEGSDEAVTKAILEQAFPLSDTEMELRPATPVSNEKTEEVQRRVDYSPEARGFGLWELIDDSRVRRTVESLEEFRFFSVVQRDAVVKKSPKGAAQQLVSVVEETTRWIVPPKSSVCVTVVFSSEKLGKHATSFFFGITGTSQEIVLPAVARIAYPEICRDEKSVFAVTKPRAIAGKQMSRVFLTSKRTYEFGPLIVAGGGMATPLPSVRKLNKRASDVGMIFKRNSSLALRESGAQETMTFTNSGIFPAEVTVSFGKEKENTFTVTPSKFTLPVGEKTTVVLRAVPETIGEISSRLVVTVRDNPTPWYVNVSCIGTRPAVTLDGKKESVAQYGRCLLTRQVEKAIIIANVSLMPVRWRILGVEKLPKEFELNSPGGLLDVNAVFPLEVAFKPTRTGVHNIPLKVEVTDSDDVPFESLPLVIKAEAHDTVLEWTREVDFKLMHVGDTKKDTVRILNKGPYEVGYILRIPKCLQGLITLSPSEGLLRGLVGYKDASLVNVDVTIRFEKEGEIPSALGVIEASFFDPIGNELLFPVQSIPVNGEAWYNRFTIKPSCIDFGSCFTDQKKQCSFELRNTGRFPLNFRLFNYKNGPALPTADEDETTVKKHRKSAKAEPAFQLGAFTVSPSSGTVPVGEVFVFQVVTLQGDKTSHKETLGIYVDHCEPDLEAKGVPFELVASPTTPGIVADLTSSVDVETVFEEQQVVTSMAQCNRSMRAYVRDSGLFSFGAALVGSRLEERFRIANSSPLTCLVKLQLLPKYPREKKEREKKDKDAILGVDGFELLIDGEPEGTDTMQLPSFESRFVTVIFTPPTLQSFNARFEAVVMGGTDPKTSALRFDLSGEGVLPTVEYILPPRLQIPFVVKPPTPTKRNAKVRGREAKRSVSMQHVLEDAANAGAGDTIQLPLTLLGAVSTRSFTVRNTGDITAHIRLTAPDEFPKDILVSKLREEILLPVGGEETFTLSFTPTAVVKRRVRLRVSVTENPYEDRELWVVGESYFQTISFDNIDPGSEDHLSLGHWYVSQPKEHVVTLRNNSPHAVRFAWDCSSNALRCSPMIGHLSAGASKPITLRLFADSVSKATIQCALRVVSIEMLKADDWDNTQTKAKWVAMASASDETQTTSLTSETDSRRNLRKVVEAIPEPIYNPTNDLSVQKTLYVSYACDFTSYKVTLPMNDGVGASDPITFPVTKIFQKRSTPLRITNTGLNVLPFSFEVNGVHNRSSGDMDLTGVFSVDPVEGEIAPQRHLDVRVTFAPRTVESVTQLLVGTFLYSQDPKLYLPMQGSAECPLVHFNVPQCDYMSNRIDGEAGPDLNPETIAVMFNACGLQSKSTVSFKVINPTTSTYRFEWIGDPLSQRLSPFRCLTPSGSISAGKQCEMTFDYTATSIGLRESKWSFIITGQVSVPFLLVGKADEPNVFLHVSRVHFGGVTVGNKTERIIQLENREDVPFPFSFDRASLDSETSFVGVKPLSGVVPAKSAIPLSVWFCPKEEIMVNVKLICRVKRLSDPLTINVKGEGLRVHSTLSIADDDDDETSEPVDVPLSQPLCFNLGRVEVDKVVKKRFVLTNDGQCSMEYLMMVPEHRSVVLSPLSGTVAPKQRAVIMLVYSPTAEETLRNFKIQCRIEKNTIYNIRLGATSYVPKLNLGFDKYDFGPCFITEFSAGAVMSTTLSMMNGEANENMTLDCILFKNDVFELDATSFVLTPGEMRNVKISFTPREVGEFTSELKILLNSSYPIFVPLTGEGVIPRIEVPIRFLKLGTARIGERRTAELRLDCRSRALTPVSLANCVDADLQEKGVSISPNEMFLLRPREVRNITVSFKPTARMPEFQRELRMVVCGREMPLAIVSASCEDAEVHLDVQNVLFDDVVVGATASRRVVIMNSGDISQRFKWDLVYGTTGEMKAIPATGVVRAHAEQTCEFVYAPKKVGATFRRAVMVDFDNAAPMSVNVEAHCVERPKADVVVEFECKARSSLTKMVPIENLTDVPLTIRPIIDNRLWTAPKLFQVNPRTTATLPVTYTPTLVTKEKDLGSIFIPFPTGAARTIQLEGVATYPTDATALTEKVVEANTPHLETFEVHNTTAQPLRFYASVNWEPEPEKGMVTVKTPVSLDVPGKQTRECSVAVCSLKEGVLRGTVQFRCTEREDHAQSFPIALRVVPKAVSSKTELVATVRNVAIHRLPITNPLEKNVNVTTRVENGSDVIFVDSSLTIPRKTTAELSIRFFPLVHKEYPMAIVTATSAELGTTTCKLNLRSMPPAPEKVTRISCPLGQSLVFPLQFVHYSKANCDFTVRVLSDAKTTPFTKAGNTASVKVQGTIRPEGQDVAVEIQYEPTSVGETRDSIEVFSPQAGLYVFPIVAVCLPPQRQGPFVLRAGQSTLVPFKNVFQEPITLAISTDSPSFVVARPTESVAAKKMVNIQVLLKLDEDVQTAQTAKLTATATVQGETLQWVYYLKRCTADGPSLLTSPVRRRDR